MSKQLNMSERETLAQMHAAGFSDADIGRRLGRHRGTVGRELSRNAEPDGSYRASSAHERVAARRRDRPLRRILEEPKLDTIVRRGLSTYWSPDQISGRLKRTHARNRRMRVSHQTIYDWIERQGPYREHWRQFLRRGGKRPHRDSRGKIPRVVSIEGRPAVVARRGRFGDWEGDTMVGARHAGAIVTLVERKSGYLVAAKSRDRQARRVRRKIERRLAALPHKLRRTITFDHGKEFTEHELLSKNTGLAVYFAHPYCSWERGLIENTNGLLRQFFPKGTDFHSIGPSTLENAVSLLNDRPRKRFGYRTPAEVLGPAGLRVALET